jgi:hypothetical protein
MYIVYRLFIQNSYRLSVEMWVYILEEGEKELRVYLEVSFISIRFCQEGIS